MCWRECRTRVVGKQWNSCIFIPIPGHPAFCRMAPPGGVTHRHGFFLSQPVLLTLELTAEAWAVQDTPKWKRWLFPPMAYTPWGTGRQPALGAISKGLHYLEKLKAIIKLPNSFITTMRWQF